MKRALLVLLAAVLAGCHTTTQTPVAAPVTEVPEAPLILASPLVTEVPEGATLRIAPPPLPAMFSARRAFSVESASVVSAASSVSTASESSYVGLPNPVAKMVSMTVSNVQAKMVHITYDLEVQSFGVSYSDDLVTWVDVGGSLWTNAVAVNPFLQPGKTVHSVWIQDDNWMAAHTPGTGTNSWQLHIFDVIVPSDHPMRFYKVYSLGPVTGLP